MKLLLIHPTNQLAISKSKFHFIEKIANSNFLDLSPLALCVLAGITPPDWEVKIVQEPKDTIDFDEEVDLVGITAATHTVKRGYEISDEFRKRGKMVVMGGIHPSVMYKEALVHCDAVCIGEAEPVWKDILEDVKQGKLKKTYRSKEHFDLSFYTSPRRDLIPKRKSIFFNVGNVETSRGCPYNCDFCTVSIVHGRKIRHRPLENLIPEIESVEKKTLFFVDDNIVSNFQYAKKLFREMIPLKKKWAGQAPIYIAKDRELAKLAGEAGCFGLLIGIESLVKEGFEKYNKSLKNMDELKEALKILKDSGISVEAHLVFGNDFETKDTMRESLENLLELDFAAASLNILVPYPGTKLTACLERQKRILSRDWNYYDINHLLFKPNNFTCEEFMEEIQIVRKKFHSLKAICSRTLSFSRIRPLIVLGVNISTRTHNKARFTLDCVKEKNLKTGEIW
ncbi:Bacteriochlorophyllide d C-12(1)-methyltransferase [subsurface metagenome]